MTVVATVAIYLLYIFLGLMLVRLVVDWTMVFARNWRPSGLVAAVLELAYSVTDPPLRALRRVLPPLRLGSFALDLAFIVVIVVIYALIAVISPHT
ncbi:MAG TPA: YggT family protein [Mycobacteriales bacterium]|jgi:YggT family protein|nr:YggT family protein [Mycobacteriales bacterium]